MTNYNESFDPYKRSSDFSSNVLWDTSANVPAWMQAAVVEKLERHDALDLAPALGLTVEDIAGAR